MEDWYKMRMLLDIIHMAASAGPAYGWIVTAANVELQKMNKTEPEPEPKEEKNIAGPGYKEPEPELNNGMRRGISGPPSNFELETERG